MSDPAKLSARERQIMDVIYARTEATATDVLVQMPHPPTRTAVRTFLRILEKKGHIQHRKLGREFVYRPTRPRAAAGRSALRRLLDVFFEGSLQNAVAAHLASPDTELTREEIDNLSQLIREAHRKKEGPR